MKEITEFCENMKMSPKINDDWSEWHSDRASVCAFRGKSQMKNVLETFEINDSITTESMEKVKTEVIAEGQSVIMGVEYLKILLKLLTKMEKTGSVEIYIKTDMPMVVMSEDMEYIQAPRVERMEND